MTAKKRTKSVKADRPPRVRSRAAKPASSVRARSDGVTLQTADGEAPPVGFRRFPCPKCGAKHDLHVDGGNSPGTWTIAFDCLAQDCGYHANALPVQ